MWYYDNLYGWAASTIDFHWVDDIDNFDVMNVALDSSSYVFKVDLEYSQHLHDVYSDLPFCFAREITRQTKGKAPRDITW